MLRPGRLLLAMTALVFALALAVAFWNGANDNGKGVASLLAYGVASPRRALAWAAISTAAGSALSAVWGKGLLAAFRAGFVGGGAALPASFFASALAGTAAWLLLATRTGLPVSTTHALTGALLGAGLLAVGAGRIGWSVLLQRFALPLALGPLVALVLVFAAAQPLAALARRAETGCVCLVAEPTLASLGESGTALAAVRPALRVGKTASCAEHSPQAAVGGSAVLDAVHWTSAGLVGFARGWNDTPKIAALVLVVLPSASATAFALVTLAMAAGGLLAGRRVLDTLAHKVTPLRLGDSLAASGASALLVSLASFRGLPLSTTHVATGGIVGAGLARDVRGVRWRVVRDIALSWVVTLPAAAFFALAAFAVLR